MARPKTADYAGDYEVLLVESRFLFFTKDHLSVSLSISLSPP